MSTFTFTPDFGARKNIKPRVNKVQFGDSYEQRVARGLNALPTMWTVTFSNRDATESAGIVSFFETAGGVNAFDWTPPNETTSRKFVCDDWDQVTVKANNYTITATFREVFDP